MVSLALALLWGPLAGAPSHAQPPPADGEGSTKSSRRSTRKPVKARGAEAAVAESSGTAAKPVSDAELKLLAQALVGSDAAVAEQAAARLAATGQESAAEALVEALAVGTWPNLAVAYLQALGSLKNPLALQILVLYAGHRDPKVRVAAVQALEPLPEDAVAGVLLERLGDVDARVRAVASAALANRKDKRAVDRLLMLVRKSDPGAAPALGQLAPLDLAPQVAELRGTIDDGTLSAALAEFLKRSDAPDRLRLDLVQTLGRVPGAEATTALVEYLASIPEGEPRASKEAAETLVEQRSRL